MSPGGVAWSEAAAGAGAGAVRKQQQRDDQDQHGRRGGACHREDLAQGTLGRRRCGAGGGFLRTVVIASLGRVTLVLLLILMASGVQPSQEDPIADAERLAEERSASETRLLHWTQ